MRCAVQTRKETNMTSPIQNITSPEYAFDLGYSCGGSGDDCEPPFDDARLNERFKSGYQHYQAEMAGAITAHTPTTNAAWLDGGSVI